MDPSGQETNPCGYVGGNPVNYIDPSGLAITIEEFLGVTASTLTCFVVGGGLGGALFCGYAFAFGDDIAIGIYDYLEASFIAMCNEITAVTGSPVDVCTGG